ncbi:MAG: alpha/beta hydrolase [Rikenellaceae bacterium]|nr:alpha/beta hydrolase [Rikenellaceae bacterium]
MNDKLFSLEVDNEYIHGIIHKPEIPFTKAIVFLHGWGGHRTGPHDMFVKFSRKLTDLGYLCLRFDFRGKGFSGSMGYNATNRSMLEDIEVILRYVKNSCGIDDISIVGICSGAKLGLYYSLNGDITVNNFVCLSSAPLRPVDNPQSVAVRKTVVGFREYISKLFYRETWAKIFKNEVDYKTIIYSFLNPFKAKKTKVKSARTDRNNVIKGKNISGKVLIINGGKDTETPETVKQVEALMRKYDIDFSTYIIAGANHSFYSILLEQEIMNIMGKWFS